jgi:hypothetical protein
MKIRVVVVEKEEVVARSGHVIGTAVALVKALKGQAGIKNKNFEHFLTFPTKLRLS